LICESGFTPDESIDPGTWVGFLGELAEVPSGPASTSVPVWRVSHDSGISAKDPFSRHPSYHLFQGVFTKAGAGVFSLAAPRDTDVRLSVLWPEVATFKNLDEVFGVNLARPICLRGTIASWSADHTLPTCVRADRIRKDADDFEEDYTNEDR
ncbi:MAG TPA: hypothetical protein PKO06_09515, partial [Candidatus Ozemobacteraceae bacterium]|nr:hypothetical protein [Candidatus Ozemobacteraceae bacterium]